jgi:hypothetical protein
MSACADTQTYAQVHMQTRSAYAHHTRTHTQCTQKETGVGKKIQRTLGVTSGDAEPGIVCEPSWPPANMPGGFTGGMPPPAGGPCGAPPPSMPCGISGWPGGKTSGDGASGSLPPGQRGCSGGVFGTRSGISGPADAKQPDFRAFGLCYSSTTCVVHLSQEMHIHQDDCDGLS